MGETKNPSPPLGERVPAEGGRVRGEFVFIRIIAMQYPRPVFHVGQDVVVPSELRHAVITRSTLTPALCLQGTAGTQESSVIRMRPAGAPSDYHCTSTGRRTWADSIAAKTMASDLILS